MRNTSAVHTRRDERTREQERERWKIEREGGKREKARWIERKGQRWVRWEKEGEMGERGGDRLIEFV